MSKQFNSENANTVNPQQVAADIRQEMDRDASRQEPAYEAPRIVPMGPATELVQGFTWGDGPDGYTGYYKYH